MPFAGRLTRYLIAASLAASTSYALPQETVFKAEVHLVNISFNVRSADGKLVPGLKGDDFEVYEDGVLQKVNSFAIEGQLPLTLGLIVDASDSQDKFLKRHDKDIETFLKKTVQPQDQVFAVCFGNHLRLVSDLTSSTPQVIDGLARFDKGDRDFVEIAPDEIRESGTALYDAVYETSVGKLRGVDNRRRALILFTDGEENASAHDLLDAIAAAQDSDVIIYAVRYSDIHKGRLTAHNKFGAQSLSHMTSQTGGIQFDGLHTNLPDAFERIGEELRSLYVLSYHSTNKSRDGRFRKVEIRPKNSELMVHAKAGYFGQ
jgi:Ca-activated chloride channel homolog